MTSMELLGEIAGACVLELIARGETGIRLQETTPFSIGAFLESIVGSAAHAHVIVAGITPQELRTLSKASGFPIKQMTGNLEVGTEWRNSEQFDGPVVLVAFAEEEKLGTFHRFTPIKDHNLYETLCIRAQRDLSPNQSLAEWWTVLRKKADIRRQISVRRLAEYCLLLQDNKNRLPDAAREGLYLLGMLPSRSFFGHPSEREYQKDFNANRALLARIETLSNTDRNKLSKSLDTIKERDREKHQTTIGLVLMYNRTGLGRTERISGPRMSSKCWKPINWLLALKGRQNTNPRRQSGRSQKPSLQTIPRRSFS